MDKSGPSGSGMRLIADIGGTNVRFALLPIGSTHPQQEKNLLCSDFPGLEQAARHYLVAAGVSAVNEAAVDVATAVTGDVVKLTNSPWVFSIEQTRRALGLTRLAGDQRLHRVGALVAAAAARRAARRGWRQRREGRARCADRCRHRTGRLGSESLAAGTGCRSRAKAATLRSVPWTSAKTAC